MTGRDMVGKGLHQEKAAACWVNSKTTCLKHAGQGEWGLTQPQESWQAQIFDGLSAKSVSNPKEQRKPLDQ